MSAPQPTTNNQQPATPTRHTCRHIFHDGHRCGSPALRGDRTFCFYHRSTPRPDPPLPSTDPEVKFAGPFFAELLLPLPEDRAAIQTGIGMVMRAIGTAKIDIRRANGLLAALKLAAQNLPPHPKCGAGTGCPIHGNAANGRTTSPSASNQQPTTNNRQPLVDDIEDSDLGPLAPILEYGIPEPEEEREPSLASIINTYLNSPPPPPPVELEKRPYDFDTLQLLRHTLATTANPETAARIRKALEEEALLPNHNLHIQACIEEPAEDGWPIHGAAMSGGCRPKVRRLSHLFSKTCKKTARPTPPRKAVASSCQLTALQAHSSRFGPPPERRAHRRSPKPTTQNPKPAPKPRSSIRGASPQTLNRKFTQPEIQQHSLCRPKVRGLSPMFSRTYREKIKHLSTRHPPPTNNQQPATSNCRIDKWRPRS